MTWTHPAVAAHTSLLSALQDTLTGEPVQVACTCPGHTDHWFDRSICPDPCGSMHDVCVECGKVKGGCRVEADAGTVGAAIAALIEHVVAAHAPTIDETGRARCVGPHPDTTTTWPCRDHTLAAAAAGHPH